MYNHQMIIRYAVFYKNDKSEFSNFTATQYDADTDNFKINEILTLIKVEIKERSLFFKKDKTKANISLEV